MPINTMDKEKFLKAVSILQGRYKIKNRKEKPFDVLIHGILSTRTKDTTTFPAQRRLLSLADTPQKMLKLSDKEIKDAIYPVGFYRTKAKLLKRACRVLIDKYGGKVPDTKKDLMSLPGVGHKVASLVLVWGFGLPFIPVDTHVSRVSQRLGIVKKGTKPEKIEEFLEGITPAKDRILLNHLFVTFGRDICKPVSPLCYKCPVYELCEFSGKKYYFDRGKKLFNPAKT